MPFVSASAALVWAVGELEAWVFGQAMRTEPREQPSTAGDGVPVLAMSIMEISGRHDVIDRHGDSCFYAWYVKEASERHFNKWDLARLKCARYAFENELAEEGFILLDNAVGIVRPSFP